MTTDTQVIRFYCYGCGKRVKAPAYYSGRRAKCTKCSTFLLVPRFSEPLSRDVGCRQPQLPGTVSNLVGGCSENTSPYTAAYQTVHTDHMNRDHIMRSGVSSSCEPMHRQHVTHSNAIILRQRYQNLLQTRKESSTLGAVFFVIAVVLVSIAMALKPENDMSTGAAIWGGFSVLFDSLAFGFFSRGKGRSFAWGLFGLIGLIGGIVPAVIKDEAKERMLRTEELLIQMGESLPTSIEA